MINLSLVDIETYNSTDYITSSAGNIFHVTAEVKDPSNVELPGGKCILKENVLIRGDLSSIMINAYTIIEINTELKPSYIDKKKEEDDDDDELKYIPLTIGKYSYIGKDCIIESACIGVGCYIGNNCNLSKRSILKDYVYVKDNTLIPPDMVIPPFSIVEGVPAKIIGEQPPFTPKAVEQMAFSRYNMFRKES